MYLENAGEDPAIKDKDLAKKLTDNRTEGEKRLAAVFEKYTKKQEETKEQNYIETTSEEEDEEGESVADDKKKDDISVTSLSEEDNDNEENRNEKINKDNNVNKDNRLHVKNGMSNINTINFYRKTDKVTSNKTILDTSQQKFNEKDKIKIPVKDNNIVIPINKNQITIEKIVHKVCNSNTIAKNVNIDAETPKDSLPTSSTADCTSNINRIEGL